MDLDIIIPVYNAKKTIRKTLYSIAIQKNITGFSVTLVNDASAYNYDEEIKFFSQYFDVKELVMSENQGPGIARQYGIDNTNKKYIMFIDADDSLYSPYSLYELYKKIEESDSDLVISNFIYQRDNKELIKKRNQVWLHGKIYKRSFLKERNIKFNNTRYNEDNGFNRLVLLNLPKVDYLDRITYIYLENSESTTRKDNRLYKFTGLEWYAYNICWAIKKASKIGIDNNQDIAFTSLGALSFLYYSYLELKDNYDIKKILLWSKELKQIYNDYKMFITDEIVNKVLKLKSEQYTNLDIFITFEEFLDRIEELRW